MTSFNVFDLACNPVPQARAKVGRHGGYTPMKSTAFNLEFGWLAREKRPGLRPLDGPLQIGLQFWRHHAGREQCGDLDNLVKAVLDAGNQLLWRDDRLIVDLHARLEDHGAHVTGRIVLMVRTLSVPRTDDGNCPVVNARSTP